LGTITVGQPDTDRPRGHPARRIQISSDVTGGWADCDVSAVDLLPLAPPADNDAPPEPTPLDVARQQRDDALAELKALRAENALRETVAAMAASLDGPMSDALAAYQPPDDSQPPLPFDASQPPDASQLPDDSQPPDDSQAG
jgi:hypothetical protein